MKLQQIRDFLTGYKNYFNKEDLPTHIVEQVELRAFMCQDCLKAGKCKHCGCKTPPLFYAPKKVDSEAKWGEFLTADQWNILKHNIAAYVRYFEEKGESTTKGGILQSANTDEELSDKTDEVTQ